jgi:hypothetical protein
MSDLRTQCVKKLWQMFALRQRSLKSKRKRQRDEDTERETDGLFNERLERVADDCPATGGLAKIWRSGTREIPQCPSFLFCSGH